jgi:hypothetical protein
VLSDHLRIPKILLLGAALVALCGWYSWQARNHTVGFARCMTEPATYDGQTIEIALWRVEDVGEGIYHIRGLERGVPVLGPTAGLTPGATVSVVGRFDAESEALVELSRELHHARRTKALLGLLGLLGFAIYAGLHFRWRGRRLVLRG